MTAAHTLTYIKTCLQDFGFAAWMSEKYDIEYDDLVASIDEWFESNPVAETRTIADEIEETFIAPKKAVVAPVPKATPVAKPATTKTSVPIVLKNYGKGLVLVGDTTPFKDALKECGKWNDSLTDQETNAKFKGWVFSPSKKDWLVGKLGELKVSFTDKSVVTVASVAVAKATPAPAPAKISRADLDTGCVAGEEPVVAKATPAKVAPAKATPAPAPAPAKVVKATPAVVAPPSLELDEAQPTGSVTIKSLDEFAIKVLEKCLKAYGGSYGDEEGTFVFSATDGKKAVGNLDRYKCQGKYEVLEDEETPAEHELENEEPIVVAKPKSATAKPVVAAKKAEPAVAVKAKPVAVAEPVEEEPLPSPDIVECPGIEGVFWDEETKIAFEDNEGVMEAIGFVHKGDVFDLDQRHLDRCIEKGFVVRAAVGGEEEPMDD